MTKVELTIACTNLLDKDVGSKSDPLCVLLQNTSGQQWYEVDRTERVKNSLNPKFAKKFLIDYYFELVQKLKFGIYDIDNKTYDLSDDDFLGELECTLGQVSLQMISLRIKLLKIISHFYLDFITMFLCSWSTLKLNRMRFICFSSLSSVYMHFICKRS